MGDWSWVHRKGLSPSWQGVAAGVGAGLEAGGGDGFPLRICFVTITQRAQAAISVATVW